jgi:hypothetical protein
MIEGLDPELLTEPLMCHGDESLPPELQCHCCAGVLVGAQPEEI